jgi:hypothetical protein
MCQAFQRTPFTHVCWSSMGLSFTRVNTQGSFLQWITLQWHHLFLQHTLKWGLWHQKSIFHVRLKLGGRILGFWRTGKNMWSWKMWEGIRHVGSPRQKWLVRNVDSQREEHSSSFTPSSQATKLVENQHEVYSSLFPSQRMETLPIHSLNLVIHSKILHGWPSTEQFFH